MAKLMPDMYQSLNMTGKKKETEKPKPKKIKFKLVPKGTFDKRKTPIPAPRPESGYFAVKKKPIAKPRPAHSLPTVKGHPTKVVPRALTKGEMEVAHMTPKQKERHMNKWAKQQKYKYGYLY